MGETSCLCGPVDQLAQNSAVWNQLVEQGALPEFLRAEFLRIAAAKLPIHRGLLVIIKEGEYPILAAIVEQTGFARWQTWQPSQLPLGAIVKDRKLSWEAAVRMLLSALPGPALQMSITQQDPYFFATPPAASTIETLDYVQTSRIMIRGSFEEFWAARGKNLRQNLNKHGRKLEEQGAVAFEFLQDPDGVEGAFIDFARLESAGWKALGGSAISVDNDQGRFYGMMLRDLAQSGRSFALRLSLNGQAIAVDFGVIGKGVAIILKTTYDESFKAVSPAQLLHLHAFRKFFEMGLDRIEFYGKVMEWHTRWTEDSRMLYHLNGYRWSMLRTLHGMLRK